MSKSKRTRRAQTKTCQSRKIVKEEIEKNRPLKTSKILEILQNAPNFVGCFAEDEIEFIRIQSFPAFFIINIDSSEKPGSHWIALGIYNDDVEIFDTLGFKIFKWSSSKSSVI